MIDPGIWTDEDLASVGFGARILYIALISVSDDEGRFKANEITLTAAAFPADEIPREQVRIWRDQLAALGLIRLYENGGRLYGVHPKWRRHQTINKPYPSTLPGPDDGDSTPFEPDFPGGEEGSSRECSHSAPATLAERSGNGSVALPERFGQVSKEAKKEGRGVVVKDLLPPSMSTEWRQACALFGLPRPQVDFRWLHEVMGEERYAELDLAAELLAFREYWSDQRKGKRPRSVKRAFRGWLRIGLERLEVRRSRRRQRKEPPVRVEFPDSSDPRAEADWKTAKEAIAASTDPHTFETWFGPTRGHEFRDGELQVLVPNDVFGDWLADKYMPLIQECCEVPVRFVLPGEARAVGEKLV